MTIEERRMRAAAFMRIHVIHGLHNLNNGFDSMNIEYFKEAEFRIVLERCKAMGIGLYGIEPWKNENFFDVVTSKDDSHSDDPEWYFGAFEKFVALGEDLDYAASFYLPIKLLELEYFPANPHYIYLRNFAEERRRYWEEKRLEE